MELVDENVYLWEVNFFNFDKTEPISQDMGHMHVVVIFHIEFLFLKKNITMLIAFPPSYPFNPPFCRILRPSKIARGLFLTFVGFAFRTGHVTVGGSICMELLTNKGWSPGSIVIFWR